MKLENGRPETNEGRLDKEIRCYNLLDQLGVDYQRVDHEAAMTMEACVWVDKALETTMCKNLMLCNRQCTDFYILLLPGDKVEKVEQLLKTTRGKLAFVGDGINDAPVLSRADVGIAMGVLGSDAAIEAADVVLMDDDPMKIASAIGISRKCMRIVRQNIVFALGVKLACLVLGALGLTNLWIAIFADVGVMVLAVLNAIRAMMVKK